MLSAKGTSHLTHTLHILWSGSEEYNEYYTSQDYQGPQDYVSRPKTTAALLKSLFLSNRRKLYSFWVTIYSWTLLVQDCNTSHSDCLHLYSPIQFYQKYRSRTVTTLVPSMICVVWKSCLILDWVVIIHGSLLARPDALA